MTFPIVPQNDALAAIAVRHEQVDCSIAVEVDRYDGCCRFCRERFAGGKVALAVVQADVTRRGDFGAFAAVGDHDVRIAVAVQVGQCHITRGPVRVAECTGLGEVSSSVIQVDKLAIRRIVADDNVQVAVAIDVRQGRRIGSIRSGAEVAGGETALAIIQQHTAVEWPMAALTQDDVGKAVAVEVAHVYACRGFTLFLQKQHPVKGAEDLACWGWRVASASGRDEQSERASCEPRHDRCRLSPAPSFSPQLLANRAHPVLQLLSHINLPHRLWICNRSISLRGLRQPRDALAQLSKDFSIWSITTRFDSSLRKVAPFASLCIIELFACSLLMNFVF